MQQVLQVVDPKAHYDGFIDPLHIFIGESADTLSQAGLVNGAYLLQQHNRRCG